MSNSSDSDCLPDLEEEEEIAKLERTMRKRDCKYIWCPTCQCVFHSARKYYKHQEKEKHFHEKHHDERHPKMNPNLNVKQICREEIRMHQVPKNEEMSPLFSSESSSDEGEEHLPLEEVRPLSVEIVWHF